MTNELFSRLKIQSNPLEYDLRWFMVIENRKNWYKSIEKMKLNIM